MSHKYFTHKDAMQQDIPLVSAPAPETVAKVRKVIASNSEDAGECAMFLDMLGISLPKGAHA